ncbi:STAS domain-containing protein [Besnoitia besnoiti]|uniref:STAS domain-containing protein n=1 Tax=Besnoitia besnoiti TaxID=94643 RepID=A0A2A9MD80_BESBE|nr:STAS domain-containing protein [Besnoitia besnoiti]PFH34251.1 STAS domain-containing protein [Besnoitia besnoiti]
MGYVRSPFRPWRDRLNEFRGSQEGGSCRADFSADAMETRPGGGCERVADSGALAEDRRDRDDEADMADVGEEDRVPSGATSGDEPHLWSGLRGGTGTELGLYARKRATVTERDIHREFDLAHANSGVLARVKSEASSRWRNFSCMHFLVSMFPILSVLKTYKRSYLNADFFSGISAGVMAVPMGMSYAMLANLPPQYGLYVGLFYPLFYMLMGTGKHVVVGVSAIEDLLAGEAVSRILGAKEVLSQLDSQRKLALDASLTDRSLQEALLKNVERQEALLAQARVDISIGLCVCIGIIYLIMRVLQAGLLADLLSVPVLSGFSTASAFLIGTSQLKHMTGLTVPPDVENADFKIIRQWWYCLSHLAEWNGAAVGICCASIAVLALCKFLSRRYCKCFPLPGPLIIVAIFTTLTYLCRLDESHGLKVIGRIPDGFPAARLPSFYVPVFNSNDLSDEVTYRLAFLDMLREAIPLTAMFFIIHISIAKTITQQKKTYQIDPDQELVALAVCNFLGSMFQCFPCAASLSRTSVVSATGAVTQLHNLSNVFVIVLTLSLITPLLHFLPNAVLAAVVLFGVYGMMDFREFFRLCRIGGLDVLLWLVCFFITVIFGAMEGILASIVLSLLWLLRKTARPQCSVLGRLPQTYIYRNVARFPMAKEEPGIKIVRFDASLNFSNSDYFDARVRQKLEASTRYLIVDGSSINDLDVTSIRMLQRLCAYLKQNGVTMLFANWKGPMRDFLQRAQFYETLLPENCFLSLHDAVFWAKQKLAAQKKVGVCKRKGGEGGEMASTARHATAPLEPFYWLSEQGKASPPPAAAADIENARSLSCLPTSEGFLPSDHASVGDAASSPVVIVDTDGLEKSKRARPALGIGEVDGSSASRSGLSRKRSKYLPLPRGALTGARRNSAPQRPAALTKVSPGVEPNAVARGAGGTERTKEPLLSPADSEPRRARAGTEAVSTTEEMLSQRMKECGVLEREDASAGFRGAGSSLVSVSLPARTARGADPIAHVVAAQRRLSSAASTARATEAGEDEDFSAFVRPSHAFGARGAAHPRGDDAGGVSAQRAEWGWDGLSACSPGMIRLVTEVTGSGSHVNWGVLRTGGDSLPASFSSDCICEPETAVVQLPNADARGTDA